MGGSSLKPNENMLAELEEDYKCLCAILLYLALTRDEAEVAGHGSKHDAVVHKTEHEIKLLCEKIQTLKKESV